MENQSEMSANRKNYFKIILLVFSALGVVLSIYLTYLHYAQLAALFCEEGSGCDVVRQSGYSILLGVPIAVLGIVGYLSIFIFTIISFPKGKSWLSLYLASLAGFVFSAYLTYLEVFVIDAICLYCIISALIMTVIFIAALLAKAELYPKLSMLKTSVLSIVVTVVIITGSMAFQSDHTIRIDPASISANSFQLGLARHLGKQRAVMYGSFRCAHCIQQKDLFGDAFVYVKYVECHPDGQDSNPSLCLEKGIRSYPTWEIKGRYYKGIQSLEKLSAISRYMGEGYSG